MAVLHQLQPSFNNGEISPLLYDRVDYQKFVSSVKSGKNMFVHAQGGMSNRAGTLMLAQAKDAVVRLIPFEFSNTETYMIECGNKYCRFHTTNGLIVNTDGTPYEISSPFATADLENIRFCQSGDVMYLAWGGKPQTLTRYGHTNWEIKDYDFKNGPYDVTKEEKVYLNKQTEDHIVYVLLNFVGRKVTTEDVGNLFKVEVMVSSQNFGGRVTSTEVAAEFKTHKFFVVGSYTLKTSGTWSGRFVLEYSDDGETWQTREEFSSYNDSNNYDFTGSFEGNPSFVRLNFDELGTYSTTGLNFSFRTDATEYVLNLRAVEKVSDYSLKAETIDVPVDVIDFISNSGSLLPYTLPVLTSNTSSADISITGNASDITNAWKMLDGNDTTYMEARDDNSVVDIYFKTPVVMSGANLKLIPYPDVYYGYLPAKISLSVLVNKQWVFKGHFIDERRVEDKLYSVNFSTVSVEAIRIEEHNDDSYGAKIAILTLNNAKTVQTQPSYFDAFNGYWKPQVYPTDVELYQDRVEWFTNNHLDATKISDYTNFGVSTDVTDDDAISVIIKDKKINKINTAIAGNKLVVFTDSGNFIHNNDTFTPNSATFLKQGSTGGASVKPVIVRDNIIYVHPMKQAISDYAYNFETDGYAGQDITILANHLFENKKIKELAYQQEPYSIIWVLQEEGTVLACTYLRQQQVIAWTPMDFGGKVISLGVLSNGTNQELYLAVQRKNGTFIEKMPTRLPVADPKERFFVDCGRTYRGDPATVITGLEYLNGETVVALADGYVVKDLVVANGQITLPNAASVVTVGLPYESVFETLTFDVNNGDGSNLNRKKRVVAVSVRYYNSRGSKISVNGHREVNMLERKTSNDDTDISLRNGFYREILPSSHDEPTTVKIRQDEPLPITIVSVIPELEYER